MNLKKKLKKTLIICLFTIVSGVAQNNTKYWQQHVDYTMKVAMNVKDFTYKGTQELVYTNNSPDTLKQVFYHLYFNAFQPGSEMDIRSKTIIDPDKRVMNRISDLSPKEIGSLQVLSLAQDGNKISYETSGTILEVTLDTPILPGKKTKFSMTFEGQVPKQIRRSGRDNSENVALSMTQWYPKISEYDFQGWHANPYVGREFHGVWGDFDVTITIDKNYILGGSGYLQNPDEIGFGYETPGTKVSHKGKTKSWHFKAPKVHDFAWAADPEYIHDTLKVPEGTTLHFLYKDSPEIKENWKKLQPKTAEFLAYFNKHIGKYPYDQYSIIQGGDGGMEYAMSTLITGDRKFGSLAGVTAHELAHSWFQHVLATNESKNEWMDEGFTTYISTLAMNEVMNEEKENPLRSTYEGYIKLATSGVEQPQTTHADRYATNFAYGTSAYSKGAVFLAQLGYVIGEENLSKTIKRYFQEWKFKHPTPTDFIRVGEKVSGMQLDWYLTDWTQTTNVIEYAIDAINKKNEETQITLRRNGLMPMPIDLYVSYNDGTTESFYIPLDLMRGEKENPTPDIKRTVLNDWSWGIPTYNIRLNKPVSTIKSIQIDPSKKLADIRSDNNTVNR